MKIEKLLIASAVMILAGFGMNAQTPAISAPDSVSAGQRFNVTFTFDASEQLPSGTLYWTSEPQLEVLSSPQIRTKTNFQTQQYMRIQKVVKTYTYSVVAKESGRLKFSNFYFEERSAYEQSIQKNAADSIKKSYSIAEKKPDIISTLKNYTKSSIVYDITGWCYSLSEKSLSGNANFIYVRPGVETPSLFSPVCYSLQICEYNSAKGHYYILKWGGVSRSDRTPCYLAFTPKQYEALCHLDEKGVVLDAKYEVLYENPKSDEEEIKAVLSSGTNKTATFAACLDQNGSVLFMKSEYGDGIGKTSDGKVRFETESTDHSIRGYFEVSGSDWKTIFK